MLQRARVNGVEIAYLDTGGEHPVLLLVHGFALTRAMWEPQIEALRASWRVIAPDLRGFGESEAGPPGPLTMRQHADDLAALLSALDITGPAVYGGLSMGGYAAFELWRRHRSRVRALLLTDTKATLDAPERLHGRHVMAEQAERAGSSAPAITGMWPHLFAPSLDLESELPQRVRAMMAGISSRAIADGQRGMAERSDSVPLLPEIHVPALIVVGAEDALTPPEESQLMHARLPNSRLAIIPGAGHMSNMEAPDTFNAAVTDWLTTLPARPSNLHYP